MARFRYRAVAAALAMSAPFAASDANAASITPDVIFGNGNANGSFTVGTGSGIELGLRGKLRFNENNQPENTFNFDGTDTYTFRTGTPPTGFGFDPNSPTTPVWNFEWSINSDSDGAPGNNLDQFAYELRLDADPGPGTSFLTFDPINDFSVADHAIGDNSTGNGGGTTASSSTDYVSLVANNNVAQNSGSYEFFNDGTGNPLTGFDPNQDGLYTVELEAFGSGGDSLAFTSINVQTQAVPVPSTVSLFAAALAILGAGVGYRRRRNDVT